MKGLVGCSFNNKKFFSLSSFKKLDFYLQLSRLVHLFIYLFYFYRRGVRHLNQHKLNNFVQFYQKKATICEWKWSVGVSLNM